MEVFFSQKRSELCENLQNELKIKNAIKWYMVMKISLQRKNNEDIEVINNHFRCLNFIQLTEETIDQNLDEGYGKINKSFDEFIQRGSGWTIRKILHLELKISKYEPFVGSSYIKLPKELEDKKGVLNIKNNDNMCLIWCILAHKMKIPWINNPNQVKHYLPYTSEIQLGNIECPVPLSKIPIIERLNNLRINVFGFETEIHPLYISPKNDDDVINLLLIADEKKQHYCLIRNFSRLLGHLTKHNGKAYYCYRCLHRFSSKELLNSHKQYCENHTAQVITLPKPGENILNFTGMHLQHPIGYVIYADFESLLVPISSTSPSPQTSYTEKMASHMPCGFAYIIIGPNGESVKPIQVYRGKDAVKKFLDHMIIEKEMIGQKLLNIEPMKLTAEDEKAFREAQICNLCKKPLGEERARDHDHLDGHYRGALHISCNINYKQPKKIPVIFHNLKNYDGHLIMQELGRYKDHQIEVIATTMENYISFSIRKKRCPVSMVFIDSFQFLPTSLEKLVKNLEVDKFKILKENFPYNTDITLLTRKGIYPYEYFSTFKKFEETELPPATAFFNTLSNTHITEEDYMHARNVWKTFNIVNLGQYHDLYVKTDVLLLADVFQNFRKLCQHYYDIDCAHLLTAPGLAWQASLKMCETPLELLTDINMLLLIEKGIRGGVSMISRRFARANNPYMDDYNPHAASSYIMYWDANNLYGWAMSQYLPYGGFEWISAENITQEWILSLPDESDIGYLFEIDLEYPEHLHILHNEYPVAPESLTVCEDMLSPYAKSLHQHRPYMGTTKLIPNLYNKKNYVVHYRNLKYYLELGLKISCIHKVVKFRQAPWLRKYIEFNTNKRKEAKSSFEKDFFKLLNNSVYGKTLENLRNRRNIVLCNNEKRAKKVVVCPSFLGFKEFNQDLTAVERLKTNILMNRPIYTGFAILELSKLLMYQFHYGFIKNIYGDRAQLLFTDTDSLTYNIETTDIFEDMKQYKNLFDFSDYPCEHPLYSTQNKKVIGKFKDELSGEIILEFVGLKSKMYSIKTEKEEKKRAKGVSTQVVRQKIMHQDYLDCLHHLKTFSEKQKRIGQEGHNIYSLKQNKVSLSPFDDKRYLMNDGITSLAYGHFKLREEIE